MDLREQVQYLQKRIDVIKQNRNDLFDENVKLQAENKRLTKCIEQLELVNKAHEATDNIWVDYEKKMEAKNKRLRDAIEAALRIKELWTLPSDENVFADEAKALLMMRECFEQALKEG